LIISPSAFGLVGSRGRPFEKLDGAVESDTFLIAGDQKGNRALGPAGRRKIVERGRKLARDGAFHVGGAAAIQQTARDVGAKRRVRPGCFVAGRHHVGVAREHEMRAPASDAGVEILDIGRAGLAESDAIHREAGARQHARQIGQRAALGRRHRGAADEVARDRDGVGGLGHSLGFCELAQSLSSSLMLVLARVFSSTRLTMTAQ
jgi:hypothetical protein